MIFLKIIFFSLLYLLLFMVVLILLLLLSPITGRIAFKNLNYLFKGSYFFGLIFIAIENGHLKVKIIGIPVYNQLLQKDEAQEEEEEDNSEDEATEETKQKEKQKRGLPSKQVLFLTLNLVKRLIRKIAPRDAYLKVMLGLDDPYYTGMSGMVYNTLFYPLNRVKHYHFIYEPVYDDLALSAEGDAYVRFSIMGLLVPVIRFILKKPIRDYLGIDLLKWFRRKEKKVIKETP